MSRLTRRSFLTGAAGAAAVAATRPAFANLSLPGVSQRTVPSRTPIDTTVVVMQENRSVDHYLGWYAQENPDFNGTQAGSYLDPTGGAHPTQPWGAAGRAEYSGCGFSDPGHGWDSGRVQKEQGFLAEGSGNDDFALSWYGPEDVPVHAALLRRFGTFDNYFCSILSSTYPNREYLHSCQSIRSNEFPPETGNPDWLLGFDWPTIWDTLTARGVTWGYYFSNLPVIALWGARYLHGARHITNFWADAAAGQLPQVCFVDPYFVAPEGLANDDHPHADLRLGQQFLSDVTAAVVESPHWERAALFITYDEWGGFWDHVTPPTVADPRAAEGFDQLGFRVPTLAVSPYVRRGSVDHTQLDHTSIVRFIESNYGLTPLNQLDPNARRSATSVERIFDFTTAPDVEVDLGPIRYAAPTEAYTTGCGVRSIADLFRLSENGWFDALGYRTDWRFEDTLRR